MEFFFFMIFAVVLLGTYLAIRRQWAAPVFTAGASVVASVITMSLFMLTSGTSIVQGIIMGTLLGALFAFATIAIAWYFHSNELRAHYTAQSSYYQEQVPVTEYEQQYQEQ